MKRVGTHQVGSNSALTCSIGYLYQRRLPVPALATCTTLGPCVQHMPCAS